MRRIALKMQFKGNRDYLQGAAMYSSIVEHVGAAIAEPTFAFRMSIHRFAHKQCDLIWADLNEAPKRSRSTIASFELRTHDRTVLGQLLETERPVEQRVAYDEKPIWAACDVRPKEQLVVQTAPVHGYSTIEVVVSMTKLLHQTILPNQRWVLTGLDLRRPLAPTDTSSLRIQVRSRLGGRHTKSKVLVKDDLLGSIVFSLVDAA